MAKESFRTSTPPTNTQMSKSGHSGRWSLRSSLTRNSLGMVVVVLGGTTAWWLWPMISSQIETLAHLLMGKGGVVWPLSLTWLVLLLLAVRFHTAWVLRHWPLWVGLLALQGLLAGLLASYNSSQLLYGVELGGEIGQALAGQNQTLIPFRLLPFGILCAIGIAPRLARSIGSHALRGIWWAFRKTPYFGLRILRLAIKTYRKYPIVRYAFRGLGYVWRARRPSTHSREFTSDLQGKIPGQRANSSVRVSPAKTNTHGLDDSVKHKPVIEKFSVSDTPRKTTSTASLVSASLTDTGLRWELPSLGLLHNIPKAPEDQRRNEQRARLLEQTLKEYGIEVEVTQIKPGPSVTLFGVVPGWIHRRRQVPEKDDNGHAVLDNKGRPRTITIEDRTRVKVDSIIAREKDLALALASPSLRIQAPVPGESVVGLEVPNANPSLVTLRSGMDSRAFEIQTRKQPLALALGEGPGGEPEVVSLTDMPHLLIAGSTGSGKSVCLNSIIACLLFHYTPLDLRLLLVDPKRVELTPFNGLPHLLKPVVVEPELVVRYLAGLIREMDRRYRLMEELGVRNIQGYNTTITNEERMPHIVVCIDELANLMMATPLDAERSICRLAQLGRATGIHMIVATQRPSVDVITGLIKANFPSRISFNVVSQMDSRTILDTIGAEKLLGRGDLLFISPDTPKAKRVQGAYVDDKEIQALVSFWRHQPMAPPFSTNLDEPIPGTGSTSFGTHDDLFVKALEIAQTQRYLSTSLLQRRLRIGYPRAARLREELEQEGIMGPGGEIISSSVNDLLQSL